MPDRPHRTTLTLEYGSTSEARTIERSIRQEVGEIDDDRSATHVARNSRHLTLTVDATDLIALRAAVNTWLSLVEVAERVAETVHF